MWGIHEQSRSFRIKSKPGIEGGYQPQMDSIRTESEAMNLESVIAVLLHFVGALWAAAGLLLFNCGSGTGLADNS